MKTSWTRLVITIAVVIIAAWLITLAFRLAAWLISGLVGIAAIIIVIALIYHFVGRKSTATSKKPPLKIEREPSKEKE